MLARPDTRSAAVFPRVSGLPMGLGSSPSGPVWPRPAWIWFRPRLWTYLPLSTADLTG